MAWSAPADPERFEEALDWFRERMPLTAELLETLGVYAGDRAWTIAGVAQLDILLDVFVALERAVATGAPISDFKKAVRAKLEGEWGGPKAGRIELIFRNASQTAYNAGRHRQMREVTDLRPYWMFDAILDSRTTPTCKARNGVVLSSGDPYWQANWPPLHHNCFPAGTLVRLDGLHERRIEQIRPGDHVLTHRGRAGRVTNVFQGTERLVELRLASGRTLTATAGHPALTQRGWTPIAELRSGDCLVYAPQITTKNAAVRDAERNEAGENQVAGSLQVETVSALGDLNAESLIRQHEVHEDDAIGENDRPVEAVAESPGLEPEHEGALRFGGQLARLRVRVGVLQQLIGSGRNGALRQGGGTQPPAFGELVGDASDARVGVLGLTLSPMLAAGGPVARRLAKDAADCGSAVGIPSPLVGDGYGASANGNPVLPEQFAAPSDVGEAEFAADLARRHPADLVEVAQDFAEAISVLLEQAELDAGLEVVAGHVALDAPPRAVFNIEVSPDESYFANGFAVHNCRSSVRALTEDSAKRRGITETPPDDSPQGGFGKAPTEPPWRPDANDYPTDLWEIFEQKQAKLASG